MQPGDVVKAQLMDAQDLDRTLDRMARQIIERLDPEAEETERLGLVGMHSRGVYLARRLREKIRQVEGVALPLGVLDATLYRDDIRTRLRQPAVRVTDIPFDIYDRRLVLVDDVLYTGRTARAALDALLDVGRPASITFLVVIDRGLRELPICADIIGRTVPTLPGEEVRVRVSELDDIDGVWLVQAESPTVPTLENRA